MSHFMTDVQMVLALTQNTINSQLQKMFQFDPSFPRELNLNVQTFFGMGTLAAGLQAPTVSLDGGFKDSMYYNVNMVNGSFKVQTDIEGNPEVITFEKATFPVKVKIGKMSVSPEHVPKHVEEQIKRGDMDLATYLNQEMFTINQLHLDFASCEFIDSVGIPACQELVSQLPEGMAGSAQDVLGQIFTKYARNMKSSGQTVILGYVMEKQVIPSAPLPMFAVTEAGFSCTTTKSADGQPIPGLNTLNILMMSDAAKHIPQSDHVGAFAVNWVEDTQADGAFVISKELFEQRYLFPNVLQPIARALGARSGFNEQMFLHDVEEGPSKSVHAVISDGCTQKDIVTRACQVSMIESANSIFYAGHGTFTMERQIRDSVFGVDFSAKGTATGEFRFEFELSAGEEGTLIPRFQLRATDQITTKEDMTDGAIFKEALSIHGVVVTYKDLFDDHKKLFESFLRTTFDHASSSIETALQNLRHQIILPAGNVFFFKNLHRHNTGDIVLNVTYKD